MARKVVKVKKKNNQPDADPDLVVLSKKKGDYIQWRAGGKHFAVAFCGESPFTRKIFHKGKASSGQIRQGAAKKVYKYMLQFDGKVKDPRVRIDP